MIQYDVIRIIIAIIIIVIIIIITINSIHGMPPGSGSG